MLCNVLVQSMLDGDIQSRTAGTKDKSFTSLHFGFQLVHALLSFFCSFPEKLIIPSVFLDWEPLRELR